MAIQKFSRKALALLLAVLMCAGYLVSAAGQSYAIAHPDSVNAGKSDAQIQADDLEQFSERSGYDYHEAKEGDYAPNELILEITSSPSNAAASISSFEDEFDLKVERVLGTTEFEDEGEAQISSIDEGECILTTYFMSTEEDDIIALCDALNERDEVFNAQPNFKYEICDETEAVDLTQPAQQPEEETTAPQNQAEEPSAEPQQEPVAQEPTAPQEPAATKGGESSVASYTDPAAFNTTGYTNYLKWWFDYCEVSSAWSTYGDTTTGYGLGKGINVAVIDTGCNTAHEDIRDNLWTGSSGQCGYYAYESKNILKDQANMDVNGHGSHCCGTIAMSGDNLVGGIGVAPKCSLMVMKADRNTGAGSFYDTEIITSLNKAKEYGADIISMSLGGYNFSYSTYRTYQNVSSSCLIVCAAGNEGFDTSEKLHFPSAASCVMGVMALGNSSNKTKLATFSNYDTSGNFYKVVAPGTSIYSLKSSTKNNYATNEYETKNGTSMATPATAGMIACFMSYIKYVKGWSWTPAQYQYEVEYLMNYSGNTLSCGAYSQAYHPVAYEKNASFKVMNLKYLFSRMSSSSTSPFANTTAVSFKNTTIRDGVLNATGYSASQLDSYAMRRVSLMYWSSESTRKGIADYSDLTKLTGLNYLDLSGSTKVTSSNIADLISKCPATIVHLNLNTASALGNLSCLSNAAFSNLHYLNISSNNITTLSSIQRFTSLKFLYANSNAIVDISALSGMTHIERIELNNNQIQDPNPAFASDFLNYIDLSHNKLSDHMQLFNYKGAYHDEDFHSDTINFFVDYNNMTGLTASVANSIKSTITNNNTINGTLIAETINFTYSNQTAPTSAVPMTSFKIEDMTVTRDALCSGNLNLNSITGFTAYPSGANQYNYLTWTCSEPGYFGSDGSVLVSPEEITSCRTLTLTGTAPEASGAKSTVTGTASQTIKLTITAPELYNAYLSERVIQTGRQTGILVATNQYATRVYMKFVKTGAEDTVIYGPMPETTVASDSAKVTMFIIPSSVTDTAGNYACYVYPSTDSGAYATSSNEDVSGKSTSPYKYLGYLYVKDDAQASTADTLNVTYDTKVNRYGQAALFATNCGTTSSSPAKPTGSYGLSTAYGTSKFIGSGSYFAAYGAGYFGKSATNYPNAALTDDATFYISNSTITTMNVESKISTIAPEVKTVEIRNGTTYKNDGYVEYLVKTNTDATEVKAYSVGTTDNIASDVNHLTTTFSSSPGSYANYNASSSYKLWSVKVPLTGSKAMQPVTITAADPLGDGTATKTPATGLKFNGSQYIYATEQPYKVLSNYLTILPADEEGNSLADCCKNVTYSVSNADYFSVYSNYNGRINVDMEKVLTDLESTSTQYKYTNVTATLESGATATMMLYAYRPIAKSLTYDTELSSLTYGGTVYYTVNTYGSDTIYVRTSSDKYSDPIITYTLADTEHYTTATDEKGNEYIQWNFTRTFETGVTTLKTYVRSSLNYSDTQTFNSASYTSNTVNRTLEPGDYSAWEAQLARVEDASVLSALAASYGDQTELYEQRLSDYQDFVDNAVLTYDETQQALIDAQTDALEEKIDTLFGYGDYTNSLEAFTALDNSENAKYIPQTLRDLVAREATATNRKEISMAIDSVLAEIQALIEKTQEVETYLSELETEIPELRGETIPQRFGADSYNTLKAQYDSIRNNLASLAYSSAATLDTDYLNLQESRAALHEHNYVPTVTAPTCTERGYTTYSCTGCDESYLTDFTTALGHRWGDWTVTTPATFDTPGEECRICARDASHIETRVIPATGDLPHTKIGDATDFTVNVGIADASTGKYKGLIDVSLKIAIDYTQLETDGEKTLRLFNQILTIDPDVVGTVSRARETRGEPNMQAMMDLVAASEYNHINARRDWAIIATPIAPYEDAEDTDMITFGLSSTSTLTYNPNLDKVLIQLSGYNDIGYLNEDDIDRPEFVVLHLYLALEDGKTLQDAKDAIKLATAADLADSATPGVMDGLAYVTSAEESAGKVNSTTLLFSKDFNPKYDITFHWYSDGGEEQTTVQPTTEGFVPEGFTPEDYQVGDYTYAFTGWDKDLEEVTGETDYYAQYEATFIGHDYVPAVTLEPTCEVPGVTTYTCSRCGEFYTEPIAALGHDWGEWSVTTAPTCEGEGVETRVCSRDANHTETRPVEALGHDWGEWSVTTAPTCEGEGVETRVCTRDANHTETRPVEALGHDYAPTVTKPTCTERGYTTYNCSRCESSYISDYVDALGHTPKAPVEENRNEPTCEQKGSYDSVVYCDVCKAELSRETKEIAALGHDWGEWSVTTAPTCEGEGVETRVCTRNANHTETRPVEALGHDYVPTVTQPTCTERGYTTYNCSRCESSYISDYVDALGHTPKAPVEENRNEPTCEQKGSYDSVVYCDVCKAELSRETKDIAALGHAWGNWAVTTAPTCEGEGVETRVCSRDANHTETRPVEALGHDYAPTVTQPTCTERGYTTYNCSRCESSYISDYVDALGHTPKAPVEENRNEPTCEQKGSYDSVVYCAVCKVELSRETKDIAALGHAWGNWAVTTAPTCEGEGVETRVCTRDANHTETRPVEALGHDYVPTVTQPTCTERGYTAYNCSRCESSYIGDYVDALGHNYKDSVIAPTYRTGGYTHHECERCHDAYDDSRTDRLPLYYIVPSLAEQEATLIFKNDNAEYEVTSTDGRFIINDIPVDSYRIYVRADLCLCIAVETYEITDNEYICEETVAMPIGDVNADDYIDFADLSVLLAGGIYGCENEQFDITGDGMISVDDIALALHEENYGKASVAIR